MSTFCAADPHNVLLDADGYDQVTREKDKVSLAIFIERLVHHMGGTISDEIGLQDFSAKYIASSMAPPEAFTKLVSELSKYQAWKTQDQYAACVADRTVDHDIIGKAIDMACGLLGDNFNCSNVPANCNYSWDPDAIYRVADYVLSFYFGTIGGKDALAGCNFSSAALFVRSVDYNRLDSVCVVSNDPKTTPLTEEGYFRIIHISAQEAPVIPTSIEAFVLCVVKNLCGSEAEVSDESQLGALSHSMMYDPPPHYHDLSKLLSKADWICGGSTQRTCPSTNGLLIGLGVVGALILAAAAALWIFKQGKQQEGMASLRYELSESEVERS